VDFAHIRQVMKQGGGALMSIGIPAASVPPMVVSFFPPCGVMNFSIALA
jgi:cell division GTPase FtsZ